MTASRRAVLTALGSGGLTGLSVAGTAAHTMRSTNDSTRVGSRPSTVHVRVYPGPLSVYTWLSNGWFGYWDGWYPVHRDVFDAVEYAFEQIADYADSNSRRGPLDVSVERGDPIDLSEETSLSNVVDFSLLSQQSLLDGFRRVVRDRDVVTGSCCHLLLWWDPLNPNLGYGGTRAPNHHVAAVAGDGAQTVANVGATDVWDSRAVTRNMAIHEVLHTFLSRDVVEDVQGTRCDHNLGRAVRTDENAMRVSPIATAYAGPDRVGGGTRWHGTGCYDHDEFSHHDGYEDVDHWEFTQELSEATLEAVTLYIDRHLR